MPVEHTHSNDAEVEISRLRQALAPFVRNVHAISLAEALAHITRENLLAAEEALAETRYRPKF